MNAVVRTVMEKNIIFVTIACCIVFYLISPRFMSIDNMSAISRQIVPIGLIALGQFFVVVSGNIDLSLGMGSVLFSIVLGVLFGITGGVEWGIVAVVVCSVAMGLANGLLVSRLKLPAFIVTLSTLFIATGLSGLIIPKGQMIFLVGDFFRFVGAEKFAGFYISFLFLVLLYALAYVVYNHTRIGAYIIAIGNNEENAKLSGINVDAVKVGVFTFAGLCSGFAGLVLSTRMGFVQPGLDGNGILMDGIAAIIIGGTLILGGKGTIGGAFWGVLFIGVINNSLNLLNVEDVWHLVFKGSVIIAALALNWLLWQSRQSTSY
ncbi:ABC transporter permease [Vibrio nigripulchritudo]|uniref:ABC transporter permease n=1 Tax=Vibrio nigripulchritudo TaxID=28173 RepID=UPI0003B2058B|nr:ABC transporter permease [Vibrio nigripulchritudo]CCN68857.1 putative Ribose/xylose/arabinose/galactoside ABC-type transport systems, permease component [Vibrio nigripulchritudo SFn118]